MTEQSLISNIVAAFDDASAGDLTEGLAWYAEAETLSIALAAGTHFTADQCAGVIAALSPRQQWARNVTTARMLLDHAREHGILGPTPYIPGTFGSSVRKAWAILQGDDIATTLNGPKTVAFWRNITGDLDAVTVDVWAARAAVGDRSRDRVTAKQYQTIAAAYRAAADIVGAHPRDVQAAVWVHTRNQWRADGRFRQS